MRKNAWFIAAVLLAILPVGGAVFASHVTEVDPETVPEGFLETHNSIPWMGAKAFGRAVANGAEVYVQHIDLDAGEATPWHHHPGPVIVAVASGSLTLEKAKGNDCLRREIPAGTGFYDKLQVHRVVAGTNGAHLYATYVLPAGSSTHITPLDPPAECAS